MQSRSSTIFNRPNSRAKWLASTTAILLGLACTSAGLAQSAATVLLKDSFPLGSGGGNALCQVQSRADDVANTTQFDRSWAIVCRDSALPVGYVFALRKSGADPTIRLDARRAKQVECDGTATAADIAYNMVDGQRLTERHCAWRDPHLGYDVVRHDRGRTSYFVEGFSAYHAALSLALRSIIADRAIAEPIEVATTSADDSEAYARIQALTLDPATALAEGYRRNNSGDYADAAAYFETLDQRQAGRASGGGAGLDRVEFLVNAALQRSDLGQFKEADRLFAQADSLPAANGVSERLRRNYEAIHQINQEHYDAALARLGVPLRAGVAMGAEALRNQNELTPALARSVNASDGIASAMGLIDDLKLTTDERAILIDAQAEQLKGAALRLLGRNGEARAVIKDSLARAIAVRDGRVVSIVRMRAQMLTELATIDEAENQLGSAEALLRSAADIVSVQYPETRSLAAVEARLASFLARHDKQDEALKLYGQVIDRSIERRNALLGLSRQMAPYFDLLIARMGNDPTASARFFAASQILVRPGVAETQAVLSRELSGGSDQAGRLFRQSLSLARSIERARMQYAALRRLDDAAARTAEIAAAAQQITALEEQERTTVVAMSSYARYRVVSQRSIAQAELQHGLAPGESYLKLAVLGPDVFVYFANRDRAVGYRAAMTSVELEAAVDGIRNTISRYEDGKLVTEAFDADRARAVYRALFDPVAGDLAGTHHLVFEPDGAMLKLPANLLIEDDASLKAYNTAANRPGGDPFDMTMVHWLGSRRMVSTSVSARAFFDARKQPQSKAAEAYLGLGHNQPVSAMTPTAASGLRGGVRGDDDSCEWPLAAWNRPISEAELVNARDLLRGQGTDLMIGAAFTDTAIMARKDLANFRVIHFATHGLVTAPSATCPARPALLTSFGDATSDGLLSFSEIFDLKLDADMVILSACDTAGQADVEATRAAGLTTGGGTALEGLVRAFIGAGGRAVLASHWPASDDFNATTRLINALFEAPSGTASGEALLEGEKRLMADPNTSHPFYWSDFAVIGDGARPLLRSGAAPVTAIADPPTGSASRTRARR
jgi:CHAT domain-containing protein